jgi:hypothetical protein
LVPARADRRGADGRARPRHAPCYRPLRRFFDRLASACGANARRVAYLGDHEHADYTGPALDLARYPTGFVQFGQVAPGGSDWRAYVEQAAASGWPDGCNPRLDGGAWPVHTQRVEPREALAALRLHPEDGAQRIRVSRTSVTIHLGQGQGRTARALHTQVLHLMRLHQRDGLLPERAALDSYSARPGMDAVEATGHEYARRYLPAR